jgi:small-conductance mechanosensitive channel
VSDRVEQQRRFVDSGETSEPRPRYQPLRLGVSLRRGAPAMRRCLVALASVLWLLAGLANAETVPADAGEPAASTPSEEVSKPSQSDRLTQLEKALASDEAKLERLKREREQTAADFEQVNDLRETLDIRIEELRERLSDSDDPEQKAALETEINELSIESGLGRKHTDILVEANRTLKEQIDTLTLKIEADRAAYEVKAGLTSSTPARAAPLPAATAPIAATTAPEPTAPSSPLSPKRYLPNAGQAAPVPQAGEAMQESATQIEARIQAERMEQKAMAAEQEIVDFLDRKQALEQQIEFEKSLISSSEKAVENLEAAVASFDARHANAVAAGASADEIAEKQDRVAGVEAALSDARNTLNLRLDDLEGLEQRLANTEEYQSAVTDEARRKRLEAEAARKRSVWLESPLHPTNLGKWLMIRGPRILLVAIATVALLMLSQLTARRITGVMVRTGQRRRGGIEKRADTLALSMRSAANIVIIAGGALLMLQEAGMNVKTVLGGAAIFGFAIAFGAQNLMRDYFNGFMILLEDQFELNDLLTIGDVTGRVEHVNLRTTVLRDLSGRSHFIPNGEIKWVTNHTYEWARAVVDICVSYSEDVDRIMNLLVELANDLRADEKFAGYITEAPEMLGVDRFNDFGPVIRFLLKTKPDRMFVVKREILRRIKKSFEEQGIELQDPNRIALQRPKAPGA